MTEYWIYRWPNPAMSLTNDGLAPFAEPGQGSFSQVSGSNLNTFIDNGSGAPLIPGTTNYWYSVRAVSQAACGPLLSAPTAPVWGVLRERNGPLCLQPVQSSAVALLPP